MEKHAPEECPRCGQSFTCKVNTISKCDCAKISLTSDAIQYIRNYCEGTYGSYKCLCNTCLIELSNELEDASL